MDSIPIESRLVSHLRGIEPYVPGEQPEGHGWVKLNTNELPYGVPAGVEKAIARASTDLRLYPEPTSHTLRSRLAELNGVPVESVFVGNGSDEILNLLARAFGGVGKRVLQTSPSYSLYPVVTALAGGKLISVPFERSFSLPLSELTVSEADLIFLTNPNAPTGVSFPLAEIEALLDSTAALVVIDEAYVEFGGESAVELLERYSNLIITRTFSKAYGLAGLRVGYAFADRNVIGILDSIRDSYNINRLSQAGALAALENQSYYDECARRIIETRERLVAFLKDAGWDVYPSRTNFVLGAPPWRDGTYSESTARSLFAYLKEREILVRYFARPLLTASHLRITVGTDFEIDKLISSIKEWTNNA